VSKWRKIKSAPKNGTFILAVGFCYGIPECEFFYDVVFWDEAESEWAIEIDTTLNTKTGEEVRKIDIRDCLTHWRPLPEPPK